MRIANAALFLGLIFGFGGCASRPPLIEEYTGLGWKGANGRVMSNIASDAAYRSAYVLLEDGVERSTNRKRFPGQFCPEPPPDVGQAINAAYDAVLKAKVEPGTPGVGVEGQAGLAAALATSLLPLARRTVGVEFLRDQSFYTCVAFLNGALDETEYAKRIEKVAEIAFVIMVLEIDASSRNTDQDGKSSRNTTTAPADIDASVRRLADFRNLLRSIE